VAQTVFKSEDPIGQRVMSVNDVQNGEAEHPERWPRVIGVVGDVRHRGLEGPGAASVYFSYLQRPFRIGDMKIVLKVQGDPNGFAAVTRQAVKEIDRNLPVEVEPMTQVFSRSTANRRYNVILLATFAGLALLLAAIGVYGVMSYAVSQSARELGIRIALGARALDVLKLVLAQGMFLAITGVVIGAFGAFALTRLMSTLLFEVTATDLSVFIGVPLLLVLVAMGACLVPARRALKVDPVIALRNE